MHLSNTLLLCESNAGNIPHIFSDYKQLPDSGCRAADTRVFQTDPVSLSLKLHDPKVAQGGILGVPIAVTQSNANIGRKCQASK
jgi:hypothetical protein